MIFTREKKCVTIKDFIKQPCTPEQYDLEDEWNKIPVGVYAENYEPAYWDVLDKSHFLINRGYHSLNFPQMLCILKYCHKHSDQFQTVCVDALKVNFPYSLSGELANVCFNYEGDVLDNDFGFRKTLCNIVTSRVDYMKKAEVESIFDVDGFLCAYYTIQYGDKERSLQFDEIVLVDFGEDYPDHYRNILNQHSFRTLTIEEVYNIATPVKVFIDGKFREVGTELTIAQEDLAIYQPKEIILFLNDISDFSMGWPTIVDCLPQEIIDNGKNIGIQYCACVWDEEWIKPELLQKFDIRLCALDNPDVVYKTQERFFSANAMPLLPKKCFSKKIGFLMMDDQVKIYRPFDSNIYTSYLVI